MKIIAHRGASGEFPENSLLAFEQAIIQDCDAIEFDVQFHQPSETFILLHDSYLEVDVDVDVKKSKNKSDTIDSTTGNINEKVHFNQLPLNELLNTAADAKYKICTLNQALECIKGQCQINIELKSAAQGAQLLDQIQRLSHLLAQAKTQQLITYQQLIISSFNHHALLLVAEHLPEITTAALIACCPITYAEFCKKLNVKMLNLSIECLNPEIVDDAHLRGLQVWVYTVDNVVQIKQCLAYQVDGIFTNFPQRTREIISTLN